MSVRITYRQGSFRKEERVAAVSIAIARAIELMQSQGGCKNFEIRDGEGKVLLTESQIRLEHEAQQRRENRQQELKAERIRLAKRSLKPLRRID